MSIHAGETTHGHFTGGPGSDQSEHVEWSYREHDEPVVPRRPSIGVDANDLEAEFDLPFTD